MCQRTIKTHISAMDGSTMAHGCADEHPKISKKTYVHTVYSSCVTSGVFLAHLAHTFSSKLRPNLQLANPSCPEIKNKCTFNFCSKSILLKFD
jgi:hypothetical protein